MPTEKPLVPKFLRQRDLEALNISKSDTQTRFLQREHSFPLGRLLSPNIRGWTEQEVADWLAARPVDFKAMPPQLKRGRSRKQPEQPEAA
jgi:predicted DNA-binding transcriptional regulator AlpA